MSSLTYPSTLPCPQTAPFTPADRVLRSQLPGLMQFAGRERDLRGMQEVTFTLSAEEGAVFYAWWRDTLSRGGLWFVTSDWPLVSGWSGSAVRKFVAPPTWSSVGAGYWRVSAQTEIRGRGLPPEDPSSIITLPGRAFFATQGGSADQDTFSGDQYARIAGDWVLEIEGLSISSSGNTVHNDIVTWHHNKPGEPYRIWIYLFSNSGELRVSFENADSIIGPVMPSGDVRLVYTADDNTATLFVNGVSEGSTVVTSYAIGDPIASKTVTLGPEAPIIGTTSYAFDQVTLRTGIGV